MDQTITLSSFAGSLNKIQTFVRKKDQIQTKSLKYRPTWQHCSSGHQIGGFEGAIYCIKLNP